MIRPGDVVTVDFPGATGIKRRPAVVLSSDEYHKHRPDLILGVLTTNLASAKTPLDHVLTDWAAVGLHAASAFRSYFGMTTRAAVRVIGRLTDQDWQIIRERVQRAISV